MDIYLIFTNAFLSLLIRIKPQRKINMNDFPALNDWIWQHFLCQRPVRELHFRLLEASDAELLVAEADFCQRISQESLLPPAAHQRRWMRALLEAIESRHLAPSEAWILYYCQLLERDQGDSDTDTLGYKHYFVGTAASSVVLRERGFLTWNGSTGHRTWEASFAMLEFLLKSPELVEDQRILELGSGLGLLGIALHQLLRPAHVCLSDGNIQVMKELQENIRINLNRCNGSGVPLESTRLDWEYPVALSFRPTLILASDTFYHPELIPIFFKCVLFYFDTVKECSRCLVAFIKRSDECQMLIEQYLVQNSERIRWKELSPSLHEHQEHIAKFLMLEKNVGPLR